MNVFVWAGTVCNVYWALRNIGQRLVNPFDRHQLGSLLIIGQKLKTILETNGSRPGFCQALKVLHFNFCVYERVFAELFF